MKNKNRTKINIGSTNKVKVNALEEVLFEYDQFSDAVVASKSVPSEISEQPKSLEETITGAMNRARNAFTDCNYSFGIESGLMKIPNTKTGYMDFCACAIYDGKDFHLGLSSAFECPKPVIDAVISENLDLNQAFYKLGMTKNKKLGNDIGAIGLLTKCRVTRKDYTKQAIRMALIHLEKFE